MRLLISIWIHRRTLGFSITQSERRGCDPCCHCSDATKSRVQLDEATSHHATRTRAMGFCYLNSIAIAALDALAVNHADQNTGPRNRPTAERVAIWDFDAHHGNGTEDIVGTNRTLFLHQSSISRISGTGTRSFGNVHNFPVPHMLREISMSKPYDVHWTASSLSSLICFWFRQASTHMLAIRLQK
jgi:hypothetical protein